MTVWSSVAYRQMPLDGRGLGDVAGPRVEAVQHHVAVEAPAEVRKLIEPEPGLGRCPGLPPGSSCAASGPAPPPSRIFDRCATAAPPLTAEPLPDLWQTLSAAGGLPLLSRSPSPSESGPSSAWAGLRSGMAAAERDGKDSS